jgi:hypothetical protein
LVTDTFAWVLKGFFGKSPMKFSLLSSNMHYHLVSYFLRVSYTICIHRIKSVSNMNPVTSNQIENVFLNYVLNFFLLFSLFCSLHSTITWSFPFWFSVLLCLKFLWFLLLGDLNASLLPLASFTGSQHGWLRVWITSLGSWQAFQGRPCLFCCFYSSLTPESLLGALFTNEKL